MEKTRLLVRRLEGLKQATILNYSDMLDFNSDMDSYDTLLEHTLSGEFDSVFLSDYLDDVGEDQREEIMKLAHEYQNLCFYAGNPDFWVDSVEGIYLSDMGLVVMKILDNFDFLVGLAKVGGKPALKELAAHQGSEFSVNGSVVDYLRNNFPDDETLKQVILLFANPESDYSEFSDECKRTLLAFPEGTLYETKDNEVKLVSPEKLVKKIQVEYYGTETDDFKTLRSLGKLFSKQPEEFENTILSIFYQERGYDFSK